MSKPISGGFQIDAPSSCGYTPILSSMFAPTPVPAPILLSGSAPPQNGTGWNFVVELRNVSCTIIVRVDVVCAFVD